MGVINQLLARGGHLVWQVYNDISIDIHPSIHPWIQTYIALQYQLNIFASGYCYLGDPMTTHGFCSYRDHGGGNLYKEKKGRRK